MYCNVCDKAMAPEEAELTRSTVKALLSWAILDVVFLVPLLLMRLPFLQAVFFASFLAIIVSRLLAVGTKGTVYRCPDCWIVLNSERQKSPSCSRCHRDMPTDAQFCPICGEKKA